MNKREAIAAIGKLSSGTVATLTGKTKYSDIDKTVLGWIETINKAAENTFKHCWNWMQILDIITEGEIAYD